MQDSRSTKITDNEPRAWEAEKKKNQLLISTLRVDLSSVAKEQELQIAKIGVEVTRMEMKMSEII